MIGLELDKILEAPNSLQVIVEGNLRRFKGKWDARNKAIQDTFFHHTHLANPALDTDEPWTAVQFANALSYATWHHKLSPLKDVMQTTELFTMMRRPMESELFMGPIGAPKMTEAERAVDEAEIFAQLRQALE